MESLLLVQTHLRIRLQLVVFEVIFVKGLGLVRCLKRFQLVVHLVEFQFQAHVILVQLLLDLFGLFHFLRNGYVSG